MKRLPAPLVSLALATTFTVAAMACSKNDSAPHVGDFDFDAGPLPDTARDTAPFDSGTPLVDSSVGDSAKTDSTVGIDTAPVDTGPKPLCPPGFVDGAGTAVVYPHGLNELLAAITWDELTMAWTTEEAGLITIHYSDRTAKDDPFTVDRTLPSSLGPFAHDKVALTADGLTMMFIAEDQQTVRQITRTARGLDFDLTTVTGAPFKKITGASTEGGSPTKKLADLVLSKDGNWLFYTNLNRTSGATIMLSIRLSEGTWDLPNPIEGARLEMDGTHHRRPTGISADKRSLFYFDEVIGATYVATRVWDTALFEDIIAYAPTGERATPAETCARVYLTMEKAVKADAGTDSSDADDPATAKAIFHAP